MSLPILTKEDFTYDLPTDLIAQEPLAERDEAKLFIYKEGLFEHSCVKNLAHHIPSRALLILNDTRVFSSRLQARTPTGGKIEIFLLDPPESFEDGSRFKAIAKPFAKLSKYPQGLTLGGDLPTKILAIQRDSDLPYAYFSVPLPPEEFFAWMEEKGFVPLPPYIKRALDPKAQENDKTRYQTVYANQPGAVAAPTAGLHFTPRVFEELRAKGIETAPVTLHVGAGTFAPVKVSAPSMHQMHKEKFYVPSSTWNKIKEARAEGRPILAVGTTSLRAIESLMSRAEEPHLLCDQWHETDLYIYPETPEDRYVSKVFSGMLTNFHQPESTLMMLISSLIGYDNVKKVYEEAVLNRYRFFSYGDTSLLWFGAFPLKSELKAQDL